MELKNNLRVCVPSFEYDDIYTQPDESMSIGEMIERHVDASTISNHSSEAYEDNNLDSPTRYDMDLTDVPTMYQDREYFSGLENARRSFVDAASDSNPKNLSNEKSSASDSKGVPMDSTSGQSS